MIRIRALLVTIALLLGLSLSSTAESSTPTLVQHVSASSDQGNALSSYSLRLPNATLAGNCVIVGFQYNSVPGVSSSVADDKGNTYSILVKNDDGRQVLNLAVALNVLPGAQKITLSFSGTNPGYVSALASEFYNVAASNALDGSSANAGVSSVVSAGSFLPSNSGDLVYQFAVQDLSATPITSWSQGAAPWTLLSADLFDSTAAQYQVQSTAASINPTMAMAPSQNFNSVAIALKSAASGTAPSPGIRVVRIQHNSIPPNTSTPVHLQFPCTGNLLLVAWIGVQNYNITSISDGNQNAYTSTGSPFGLNQSGDNQIFYAASASTSTVMTGPTLSISGTDISGSTAVLFDVTGASTSPFDSVAGRATAAAVQSSAGNISAASIIPSASNGLVISTIGVTSNTVNGVTPGNFLSAVPNPVVSPNPTDQNNGWALAYNNDTSPQIFNWSTQGGAVNSWASIAVVFQAAAGQPPVPDFAISLTPGTQNTAPTGTATYSLNIQSLNGFNSSVQISCSGLPAGATCNLNGTSIPVGSTSLVITTQNVVAGSYTFQVSGSASGLTHTTNGQITVSAGTFSGSVSPSSASIAVASSQNFSIQVTSSNGFQGSITLSCPNLPMGISCTFNPNPLALAANSSASSTLTIAVTAKPASASANSRFNNLDLFPTGWLTIAAILVLAWAFTIQDGSAKSWRRAATFLLIATMLSSCANSGGGAGSGGGTPFTTQVLVQGASGSSSTVIGNISITVP